jgi:hypothetical protein
MFGIFKKKPHQVAVQDFAIPVDDAPWNSHIEGLDGWFQESNEHDVTARPLVKISGTYTIYTQRLTSGEVEILDRILLELPGRLTGLMNYFGDPKEGAGLVASFEPSGIQIFGEVLDHQWNAWDSAFRDAVDRAKLPRFPA